MGDSPSRLLATLERQRLEYGGAAAGRRLALLQALERRALPRAAEVQRLHEALCFLRAYPDDARVLAQVERMLAGFDRRRDLRRHRATLADSGIAGTDIRFRFFAPMASWLARHWPGRLAIRWREFENQDLLERLLPLLVHFGETPAIDEYAFPVREWIRRLKGPHETGASFLIRRFERLKVDPFARELLYDELDVPMVLAPGPGTPSRTRAKHPTAAVAYPRGPIVRARPALRAEIIRPPRAVRLLEPREGRRLIDLAREAMVTRQRDLDVFSWASEDDVRLVDCGEGLSFACVGAIPERRLLLEAVYGYLTLRNGVPVGYVLSGALFESAEVAYNVFETYRGAEAAAILGRVLAMIRALFGAGSFMIPPYQLGEGNDEALRSGAWWFYQKLGFRPRDAATLGLMRRELGLMKRRPSHRSSTPRLERLARTSLYFHLGAPREDVMGRLALPNVGLHVSRYLAGRFGADRERGARECMSEAAELLGVRSPRGWSRGERIAWERWSPLVMILPGIRRWSPANRRALAAVIRAKGARGEADFVRAFDRHGPLRRAIAKLAEREPDG
jgi:hypothetical protein